MLSALLAGLLAQSPPPLVTADPESVAEVYPGPASFSRLGLAGMLGVGLSPASGASAIHGRFGVRFGLLERTRSGAGVNLALAVLGGAGKGPTGTTLGLDLRLELIYLGNKVEALEPIGNLYFTSGIVVATDGRAPIGYHVGLGLGFDLMFSGALGNTAGLWAMVGSSRELGLVIGGVILLITSPTIEGRYTTRADGSGYGSFVIGIGI